MAKRALILITCLTLAALLGGCASVDSSQRLGQVDEALKLPKGVELIWQKEEKDAALVKQKVEQALAGGLSQEEAVAVALINNQALQASLEELGVSQAELVQAGLFSNPSLEALVTFPLNSDESGTNLEFTLGFNVADVWLVPIRKDLAQASLRSATLEVAQMVLDTRRDVKAAYARVYYLGQALETHQQAVKLMAQTYEAAQRRQRFGYLTELELQNLAADTAQTELEQAQIAMELSQARNSLLGLLGLPGLKGGIELFAAPADFAGKLPSLDKALALAQDKRLDLRLAQARAAQARHELRLEKASIIEEAGLGVNWERDSGGEQVLGPQLEIELPVFDRNQAQIAKAEYLERKARKKALALKAMVFEQVSNRLAQIAFLHDKHRITGQRILPARERASSYAVRWASLMQLSQLERLEAEAELIHTRLELIHTRLDMALALAELELELGGRLPE